MEGLVLGRIGHYFDAGNGSCSTALVVHVFAGGAAINLVAWHQGGEQISRTSVPVSTSPSKDDETSSFHLNRDCPWGR